jgi:hypothetical protein
VSVALGKHRSEWIQILNPSAGSWVSTGTFQGEVSGYSSGADIWNPDFSDLYAEYFQTCQSNIATLGHVTTNSAYYITATGGHIAGSGGCPTQYLFAVYFGSLGSPWVKTSQFADVSLEAFPNRTFRGKLWRISPTVEQSKRTFIVEALIENPNALLKPGSYAKARIHTDKLDMIKLVPTLAINYVFGSNKVYVVKGDVIEARDVKIGDRFGSDTEVVEGLKDSERIAITQVTRLDTGVKVQVEK